GGKNASVVFADADLDRALPELVRAAFTNQGQVCLCGSRILIQRPIYDRVRDALVERTRALKVGDPREPDTDQGARGSRSHTGKVPGWLGCARGGRGRALRGAERVRAPGRCQEGWFGAPTRVEGLDAACRANPEEVFGPGATLLA